MAYTQEQDELLRKHLQGAFRIAPQGDLKDEMAQAIDNLVAVVNARLDDGEKIAFNGTVTPEIIDQIESGYNTHVKDNMANKAMVKLVYGEDFVNEAPQILAAMKDGVTNNWNVSAPVATQAQTPVQPVVTPVQAQPESASEPTPAAAQSSSPASDTVKLTASDLVGASDPAPTVSTAQPRAGATDASRSAGTLEVDDDLKPSVAMVEGFLAKINAELSGKGFSVKQLQDPDEELDSNTIMALQSGLVAISNPMVLDIPEGLGGLYTPEIGAKISAKLKDPEVLERLGPDAKKQLNPQTVDAFILSLNTLHGQGKLGDELLIDPKQVSPGNMQFMALAAMFVNTFMPFLKDFINPLLQKFTGKTLDDFAANAPAMDGSTPLGNFINQAVGKDGGLKPFDPDADRKFDKRDGPDIDDGYKQRIAEEQNAKLQEANKDIRQVQNSSLLTKPTIGENGIVHWYDPAVMREIEHVKYLIDGASRNAAERLHLIGEYEEAIKDVRENLEEARERNAPDLVKDYEQKLASYEIKHQQAIEHYEALRYGDEYASYFDRLDDLTEKLTHSEDITLAMRSLEYMSAEERKETLINAYNKVEGYEDYKAVADICAAYYGAGRLNDYFEDVLVKRFNHSLKENYDIALLQNPSEDTLEYLEGLKKREQELAEAEEELKAAEKALMRIPEDLREVSDELKAVQEAREKVNEIKDGTFFTDGTEDLREKYRESFQEDLKEQEERLSDWMTARKAEDYRDLKANQDKPFERTKEATTAPVTEAPKESTLLTFVSIDDRGKTSVLTYDPANHTLSLQEGDAIPVAKTLEMENPKNQNIAGNLIALGNRLRDEGLGAEERLAITQEAMSVAESIIDGSQKTANTRADFSDNSRDISYPVPDPLDPTRPTTSMSY